MATLLRRDTSDVPPDSNLQVVAFRMYPDSSAMIRLHPRAGEKSVLNIHLTAAEADALAQAIQRRSS